MKDIYETIVAAAVGNLPEAEAEGEETVRTVALTESDIIMLDSAEVDFDVGEPVYCDLPECVTCMWNIGMPCDCNFCYARYLYPSFTHRILNSDNRNKHA